MLSSCFPPCHITMPQFSQHKKDEDRWFSQPFYSAPGGYKLCLRVDADGVRDGKGKYISVVVYLMKGENDHQLKWPFEHDVTYGILNWKRDENHVITTIRFTDAAVLATSKARVTSAEKAATGYGHLKLLTHVLLYSSQDEHVQYLNEDCLCLQVLKVEPSK